MIRDELEVALNDVILAARAAADGYDTAAGLSEGQCLTALLCEGRKRCRAAAAALETEQRRRGHPPKAKDEENILVREVVTHVKAALAMDDIVPVLQERRADEERMVDACRTLLALDPPPSLRRPTGQLLRRAESARGRLAALARED